MITRDEAFELLKKYNKVEMTLQAMAASEDIINAEMEAEK